MAWEEWEQVKASAVDRQSALMRLNQLPADRGGTSTGGPYGPPSGNLRSDKPAWSKAGQGISDLCSGLAEVLEKTGNDQLRTHEAIKAEIAELRVESEDMSSVGGKGL